jgi:hypothetical protein
MKAGKVERALTREWISELSVMNGGHGEDETKERDGR